MSRQKELVYILDSFTESIKTLFKTIEKEADEFSYIEGKTVYKKETDAKTFIIAKYASPYEYYEYSEDAVAPQRFLLYHVNKENKEFQELNEVYRNIANLCTLENEIEIAARTEVCLAVIAFNLAYNRDY